MVAIGRYRCENEYLHSKVPIRDTMLSVTNQITLFVAGEPAIDRGPTNPSIILKNVNNLLIWLEKTH